MEQPDNNPWYRQFWPWFIVGVLAWGVVSASITLGVALKNPPHMLTGDYARLGKALVDTHERADAAEALGLTGRLVRRGAEWALSLEAIDPGSLDERLVMLVQHPTDSSRDRQIALDRIAPGEYRAAAVGIPERGRIIVSDPAQSWWISSRYRRDGRALEAVLKPERL